MNATKAFFEKSFGKLPKATSLNLKIGAFATAYSMERKEVGFSCAKKFINCGLNSKDIVSHEVFHGLFCMKFKKLCNPDFKLSEDHQAAHEALAYFFGYTMNPDKYYGENYRQEMAAVRPFVKTLIPEIMVGTHGKGMGLFSALVSKKVQLEFLGNWLGSLSDASGLNFSSLLKFTGSDIRIKKFPFQMSGLGSTRVKVPSAGLEFSILASKEFGEKIGSATFEIKKLEDFESDLENLVVHVEGYPLTTGKIQIAKDEQLVPQKAAVVVKNTEGMIISFYPFIIY